MKDSRPVRFQRFYLWVYITVAAMIVVKHGMERHDTLTVAFGVSGVCALAVVGRLRATPKLRPRSPDTSR